MAALILLTACGGSNSISGSTSPDRATGLNASAVDRDFASGILPAWNSLPGVGLDTNMNEVRDDIDAYILKTWGAHPLKAKAATQMAVAIQRAVASGMDINIAAASSHPASSPSEVQLEAVSQSIDDAVVCLGTRFSEGGSGSVLVEMESATTNTKERFKGYRAYNSARSGSSRALANTDPALKCK